MKRSFTLMLAAFLMLMTNFVWGQTRTTLELTFPLTSNPGEWPTANSNTLTNYVYTLDNVDYTFALRNVKCNNGYLMMTQVAALGLPAIDGYKLTTVAASNSMKFITIYDYAWWGVSLDDIDEVARMRRVVNDTNWEGRVNVVFTVNEEAHQIVVHSKMTILYVSSITGLSSYLKDVLNEFFRAKFLFENALEKQRKGNL